MLCPECGKEINERARFCTHCGKPIVVQEMTPRSVPTTPQVNRETKTPSTPPLYSTSTLEKLQKIASESDVRSGNNTIAPPPVKEREKPMAENNKTMVQNKNIAAIFTIVVGVVVLVIAGVVGVLILTGDQKDNTDKAKSDVTTEQRELPQNFIEKNEENRGDIEENLELGQEKLAVLDYILSSANETMDKQELEELLNKLISFAEENQAGKVVTEKLDTYYEDYLAYVFAGLDNLNSLEERPAIYIQMRMDLDSAKSVSENMLNAGIDIDISAINEKEKILDDYSDRLVRCFDTDVENTIRQNGVISRSVAWGIMERCNETGLYDENDMDDPLHIRYMTALALKVDSELDSLGTQAAINRLYETIPLTDYNPLLIYYLAEKYDDMQAKEWMSYINTVLPNFETCNIGEKRNFVYYYMGYITERKQIREYMQDNF